MKLIFWIIISFSLGYVMALNDMREDSNRWKERYHNLYEQMQNSSHINYEAYEECFDNGELKPTVCCGAVGKSSKTTCL